MRTPQHWRMKALMRTTHHWTMNSFLIVIKLKAVKGRRPPTISRVTFFSPPTHGGGSSTVPKGWTSLGVQILGSLLLPPEWGVSKMGPPSANYQKPRPTTNGFPAYQPGTHSL